MVYNQKQMTYSEAQTHCSSMGMEIVHITNSQKNEYVGSLLPEGSSAGSWAWIANSGKPSDYSSDDYQNFLPDQHESNECAIMFGQSDYTHDAEGSPKTYYDKWNGTSCTTIASVVCERLPSILLLFIGATILSGTKYFLFTKVVFLLKYLCVHENCLHIRSTNL